MFSAALVYLDNNLALNKPASQPSTYSDAVAARAVDGDRGTMSCTLGLMHPWLSVDLGTQYDISHVTVMNDLNAGAGNYRQTYRPSERKVAQVMITEYAKVHGD